MATVLEINISRPPLRSSFSFSNDSHLSLISFRRTHLRFQVRVPCKSIKWESFVKTGDPMKMLIDEGRMEKKAAAEERRGRYIACRAAERAERGGLVIGTESGVRVLERMKVVSLMAFVMCLCNADRVVMSVAIVPLAAKHGWNSSFLGIVQVPYIEREIEREIHREIHGWRQQPEQNRGALDLCSSFRFNDWFYVPIHKR